MNLGRVNAMKMVSDKYCAHFCEIGHYIFYLLTNFIEMVTIFSMKMVTKKTATIFMKIDSIDDQIFENGHLMTLFMKASMKMVMSCQFPRIWSQK